MNSPLTQIPRPASAVNVTNILTQRDVTASILELPPRAEHALPAGRPPSEQLLFVLAGGLAVSTGEITTVVHPDAAFLLPPGAEPILTPFGPAPARVLRVEIPPRQVVTPQIITPRA